MTESKGKHARVKGEKNRNNRKQTKSAMQVKEKYSKGENSKELGKEGKSKRKITQNQGKMVTKR